MFYNIGELTYEECIKIKKQGFVLPLYVCEGKYLCPQYQDRKGRLRCPGKLLQDDTNPNKCGWDIVYRHNVIPIQVNEPEKFTPQHIIPII